jgi:hypothetical protein
VIDSGHFKKGIVRKITDSFKTKKVVDELG